MCLTECTGRNNTLNIIEPLLVKATMLNFRGICVTLPETNMAHENRPSQKESSLPTIKFSGAMLVSGSVIKPDSRMDNLWHTS